MSFPRRGPGLSRGLCGPLLWSFSPKSFAAVKGSTTVTNEKKPMTDLSQTAKDVRTVVVKQEYLDALRKEVGLHIDPMMAEVEWIYAQTLDPYRDDLDLAEDYQQVGRAYFARSPGTDVWIWFGDLPEATRDILWEKHRSKLAVPAVLFFHGAGRDT